MRRACIALIMSACLFSAAPAYAESASWDSAGHRRGQLTRTAEGRAAASPLGAKAAPAGSAAKAMAPAVYSDWSSVYVYSPYWDQDWWAPDWDGEGNGWRDGMVVNTSAAGVQNVVLRVDLQDYDGTQVDTFDVGADCWVLPAGDFTPYSVPNPRNTYWGATHIFYDESIRAIGSPATIARTDLTVDILDSGPGVPSGRWWDCRITNNTATTVDRIIVTGYEDQSGSAWSVNNRWDFLDALYQEFACPPQLAPGQSFDMTMWGDKSPNAAKGIWGYVRAEALVKDMRKPVYRFVNLHDGFYLWSADPNERADINAKLSATWKEEGVAYRINPTTNQTPMWRFRNLQNGSYLWSADPNERADINAKLSATWKEEGQAWSVSAGTGTPVYRFRNLRNGSYLWSSDPNERANINATLSTTWKDEGVAYRLAP